MTAKGSTAAEKVSVIIVTSQEREATLYTQILLKVFRCSINQNRESVQACKILTSTYKLCSWNQPKRQRKPKPKRNNPLSHAQNPTMQLIQSMDR